ncbi:MAG: hypothetical protein NTY74_07700 [Ignavibacteriae bacterium]|nr:hypothetical protein [Ignavibacteriota bacterium]
METNKNNEDLLYSLPDYITGKLNDEGIRHNIEEEIRINAGFREEYELMKETFSSIKDLEFSEPPAHYFTNMVPRINQRIGSNSGFTFAHIFRLANLFKYALPAVSVIVLIFIFTFSNKSSKNENMFVHTEDTITEIMKNNKDTIKTIEKTVESNATEEKELTDNTTVNTSHKVNREKNTNQTVKTVTEKPVANNIESLFADTEQTENFDDYVYETDFSTLSGKEQADLIKKLSNTKF